MAARPPVKSLWRGERGRGSVWQLVSYNTKTPTVNLRRQRTGEMLTISYTEFMSGLFKRVLK